MGQRTSLALTWSKRTRIIPVYANLLAFPRCLVYLLDKYFSKFPPRGRKWMLLAYAQSPRRQLIKITGTFSLRPVTKEATNKDYWYKCAPVGKKT